MEYHTAFLAKKTARVFFFLRGTKSYNIDFYVGQIVIFSSVLFDVTFHCLKRGSIGNKEPRAERVEVLVSINHNHQTQTFIYMQSN